MPFIQRRDTPIALHSGGASRYFVDADEMFADRELRAYIVRLLDRVVGYGADILAIERGGVPWANALIEYSLSNRTVYPVADDDPKAALYAPVEHRPLVVLDDVATTGETLSRFKRANKTVVIVNRAEDWHPTHAFWRTPLPMAEKA